MSIQCLWISLSIPCIMDIHVYTMYYGYPCLYNVLWISLFIMDKYPPETSISHSIVSLVTLEPFTKENYREKKLYFKFKITFVLF